MDLNLIRDVKFDKITKSDDGVLSYSYDGVSWDTVQQSIPPFFITNNLDVPFTTGATIDAFIDFEFAEAQPIYNIDFDFSVSSFTLKYQYSIDGINYFDFEYFKIEVDDTSDYHESIFRKDLCGNKYRYGVYGRNDVSLREYGIIESLIENGTPPTNTPPIQTQLFSVVQFDIIKYLYADKYIKYLRIVLNDMDTTVVPFTLLNLDILSKKVLTSLSDVYDVTFIKHHLYRQRYFSEYKFIPSMTSDFLTLLSNKEQNV